MFNEILLFVLEKLLGFLQAEIHLRRTGKALPPQAMPKRRPLLSLPAPRSAPATATRRSARGFNPIPFVMLTAGAFVALSLIWRNRETIRGWIGQSQDEE